MATITIQTRDGSNPQNKPKLYVCAHPDDYAEHFSRVASEIWDAQDVALCYDQGLPTGSCDDDYYADLQEMRLVVAIVTNRFLSESNHARDTILPFFTAHNVPVLPLVRQAVSDKLFEEVLGDRQYLNAYANDDTALPYAYKLRRFLQTVLPSDDLAAQIRDAFRGHIFISYRKVDRAQARRLIDTIRDNPTCRDAAIWYDEFLTPGEDFNEEIADAIKGCDLFAMAITPNTLKDQNYIIHTEYPYARKHGKRILPVECVPVDRARLAEHFESIPDCVGCDDGVALSAALSDAFAAHASADNDPQRNYLIGLAHLYGMGAEPNVTRAFARIASAARAGLTEAHLKLAQMHWNGDGVPINREAAMNVLGTLLLRLKHAHKTSGKPEDAIAYANALARMAEMLCEQGKYDDALTYAKDARRIANELSLKKIKDDTYDALVAKYAVLCSEIYYYQSQDAKGGIYFLEAFFYSDWGTDDADFRRRWISLLLISFFHTDSKNEKTVALALQALSTAQALYDESGSAFDKELLLKSLLCAIKLQTDVAQIRPLVNRAIALADTMQLSHLSEEVQRQVAEAYAHGALYAADYQENEAYMQKALDIAASRPDAIKFREIVPVAYMSRYAYLCRADQADRAAPYLEQSIVLMRDVAKETARVNDYQSLIDLECIQHPEYTQNAEAYLQFQLERWAAAHKAHPESKPIRNAYRGRRRVWRWRWLVLPFVSKLSKKQKTDAE